MKSIADFKRRLKVGAKVHTTYHQAFNGRDENGDILFKDEDKGVREVSIVQSNSFALKTELIGGVKDSWCNYPKKDEVEFIDNDTILIKTEDFRQREKRILIPCLTYKFV